MADGSVFAIAESEVTQMQFHRVLGRTPPNMAHVGPAFWAGCPAVIDSNEPDLPITCITPREAAACANALTEIENRNGARQRRFCYDTTGSLLDRNCTGYRIPTFAEWKQAATAGACLLMKPARSRCVIINPPTRRVDTPQLVV
jgi:formylglycine-generating enzyme required for sulfatase activity